MISSKTFTTLETLTNAAAAREWLLNGLDAAAGGAGIGAATRWPSTSSPCRPTPRPSPSSASTPANMLEFWDWVGGRYSYDSAIGFSLMVAIGREAFADMLAGFHTIDEHFRTTPARARTCR